MNNEVMPAVGDVYGTHIEGPLFHYADILGVARHVVTGQFTVFWQVSHGAILCGPLDYFNRHYRIIATQGQKYKTPEQPPPPDPPGPDDKVISLKEIPY